MAAYYHHINATNVRSRNESNTELNSPDTKRNVWFIPIKFKCKA